MFTQVLVFASDGDDDGSGFAFLFLTLGFVFYGIQYVRYRNADKRHYHERETKVKKLNVEKVDEFLYSEKGLTNSSMRGANHERVGGALKSSKKWYSTD